MYSSEQPTWHHDKACGPTIATNNPQHNLSLNQGMLKRLKERGLDAARDLLRAQKLSSFDEGVMAGLRWIAHAIRERDFTQKYLSFYIALEALFARDTTDGRKSYGYIAPAASVDDGVAFLLGTTPEARIRLAARTRELARTRNMIVHRGYTSVERSDLLTIADYSWNCCVQGLKMRTLFQEENSFREWFLRKKYETLQDDSTDANKTSGGDIQ